MKVTIPRYQQIAADVAAKIVEGYYSEGEKIYVRSSLSSQYGVSSETARRAISALSDMKIVEVTKGSGVLIKSKDKAKNFVNKFNSINEMSNLKKQILTGMEQQIQQNHELKGMISELLYKTERFREVNPLTPFEIELKEDANYIRKSISDVQFWQNTTATIIAIKRENEIIISPGPYAIFCIGDIICYIGDENCHERVQNFFHKTN